MPFYQQHGKIPPKRHTVFSKPDNNGIYFEELISRQGFSDIYSNVYHLRMPTQVITVKEFVQKKASVLKDQHRHRHIRTSEIKKTGDAISSRELLFFNSDLQIHKAHIDQPMKYHYRNGHYDELIYIQSGTGHLNSNFGNLELINGDYVVIPRGVIWQLKCEKEIHALILESSSPVTTPRKYRNNHGQLLEHSPYCERDIHPPEFQDAIDEKGEFIVRVRLRDGYQDYVYSHHPFDIVGWDGYYFPWKLNIYDFEPIVGSIHQPPPVHQTFESGEFVICSFVSRLFDFHPNAIPAPYPHSNVDSDEVIFYSQGEFMSRKGIELESITFHPSGLPHGPQPGKYEESIGKSSTEELAVMIDTFRPLKVSKNTIEIDDPDYPFSWIKG